MSIQLNAAARLLAADGRDAGSLLKKLVSVFGKPSKAKPFGGHDGALSWNKTPVGDFSEIKLENGKLHVYIDVEIGDLADELAGEATNIIETRADDEGMAVRHLLDELKLLYKELRACKNPKASKYAANVAKLIKALG